MSEKEVLEKKGACRCGSEHSCGCGGERSKNGGHSCGCGESSNDAANAGPSAADVFTQDFALPKPSLITLTRTIAQQAMVSMGVLPNPITGKSVFLMNQATHMIDTVELIFEKTAGNRTEDETRIIENALHELRMLFVAASNEKNRRDAEQAGK